MRIRYIHFTIQEIPDGQSDTNRTNLISLNNFIRIL